MFTILSILCLISVIAVVWLSVHFDTIRLIIAILPVLIVGSILAMLNDTPTAMDVYQNKTKLKYTIVDGVKTDSVVVWKEFND